MSLASISIKRPVLAIVEGDKEKVGDIEPGGPEYCCRAISDKAMAIGGGVLEAVMHLLNIKTV